MSGHTRTPWQFDDTRKYYSKPVIRMNGIIVAEVGCSQLDTTATQYKANGEFIVRACNSHEALVEALKDISGADPQSHTCGPNAPQDCLFGCSGCCARAALALARGEQVQS